MLNARWALSAGELGQFMQCASQLTPLLESEAVASSMGAGGSSSMEVELLCCRFLLGVLAHLPEEQPRTLTELLAMTSGNPRWTGSWRECSRLADAHAKELVRAVRTISSAHRLGKFHTYLRCRSSEGGLLSTLQPNNVAVRQEPALPAESEPVCTTGAQTIEVLLAHFDTRVRLQALQRLCRAFPAGLALEVLARYLHFKSLHACAAWCQSVGCVVETSGGRQRLNTQISAQILQEHKLLHELLLQRPLPEQPLPSPPLPAETASSCAVPVASAAATVARAARARALARKAKRLATQSVQEEA